MIRVRTALAHLAQGDPSVRAVLAPLIRQADKWKSLPKGWDQSSVEKFWGTLTNGDKYKVTKCIKNMGGKVDDPGLIPEWEGKGRGPTQPIAVLQGLREAA